MHIVNSELPIRVDRYLKRLFPTLTQGVTQQLLRHGKIKINGQKGQSSTRVSDGDELLIPTYLLISPKSAQTQQVFTQSIIKLAEKILDEYLLFENDYLIAINKPAKLATQGGSKISLSINDALNFLNNSTGSTMKLVHRLDKETSGILLIAKTHLGASKLTNAFKDKIIHKKYLAIVAGVPSKAHGEISSLIAKNREGSYEMMSEDDNGKLAITKYKVIKKFGDNTSMIEFTPLTGRTHQLRVHATALKCHIIGDLKYGNSDIKSEYMLLHACYLTIPEEIFDEKIVIEAPLPLYFQKTIKKLPLK